LLNLHDHDRLVLTAFVENTFLGSQSAVLRADFSTADQDDQPKQKKVAFRYDVLLR
jgi:hypothetical protein